MGIGVPTHLTHFEALYHNEKFKRAVCLAKHFLFEEAGVIPGSLMDIISPIISSIRSGMNSNDAMGGIQLLLSSDFLQSPPIETTKTADDIASTITLFESKM